jgi:serine/threonine-protein kinase RsbW
MDIYTDLQTNFDEEIIFSSIFSNITYSDKIVNYINEKITIPEDIFGNILLSLSEAINNAIVHGNKFNKDKLVYVKYKYKNDILVLEIKDEGEGFNPDEVPDPTTSENVEKLYGRGVFLIISLADKVEFEYSDGQIVRMYFNLKV